jgi:hypothetical protein
VSEAEWIWLMIVQYLCVPCHKHILENTSGLIRLALSIPSVVTPSSTDTCIRLASLDGLEILYFTEVDLPSLAVILRWMYL